MQDYIITTAKTDADIQGIARCAEITWHDTYDELLPDGQVEYMIDRYQSADVIKHDISQNGYVYYIAVKNQKIIAYCGIKPEQEKLFVSKIYVLPEYQRQGIASSLFKTVLENYSDRYSTFYLTVNKNNEKAILTYTAFGFKQADTVITDIGCGYVMDDYIMEYKVTNGGN